MRRPTLNHTYRLVWNHVTQAFVPAAETARARGKSGRKALVEAVAGAVLMLGAGSALATSGSCPGSGSPFEISGPEGPCMLSSGGSLTITDTGSITATSGAAGIQVIGPNVGAIINSGSITGTKFGILSNGTTGIGSISNAGRILIESATSGPTAAALSGIAINNTGTSSGAIIGLISNEGDIDIHNFSTTGTVSGIQLIGDLVTASGIHNSGSIDITTNVYVSSLKGIMVSDASVNGGVSNSGTIHGTLSGGSISGTGTGIAVVNGGSVGGLANSGVISGFRKGIAVLDSAANGIGNSSSGSITGFTGILIESSVINGSVTNSGRISAAGVGILIESGSSITGALFNTGTISSGQTGIGIFSSSVAAAIGNSGLIDADGEGIMIQSGTLGGGLTNTGTISAGNDGVDIDSSVITGTIYNTGLISAESTGLEIDSSDVYGSVINTGTIAGSDRGIDIGDTATITGGIINAGTISGSEYALRIGSGSIVSGITIAGDNTARFIGEVYAPDTAVSVAANATYTMQGGELFTVNGNRPVGPSTTQPNSFDNLGKLAVAAGATGTIDGNYTQAAGATFRTYVNDQDTYGKLVVTGTATLEHNAIIDVKVNSLASLSPGNLAGIISAGTLDSDGTFVTTDDSTLYKFTAVKNGNNVDLNVAKEASLTQIANAHGNTAARGAARVLDRILENPNSDLATVFGGVDGETALNNAVTQTLPLLVGASQTAAANALSDINRVLQSRLEAGRGQSSGDGFYAADGGFWLKPFGSWADQNDRNGVSGYETNTVGLVLGTDGKVSDSTRLGLSFAYAKVSIDGNSSVAKNNADVDVYQLLGYGSRDLDQNTALDFQIGFGKNMNSGERNIGFTHDTAKSNYESLTATLGAGLSRVYSLGEKARFTPSIRADYSWIQDEDYHEKGADALNLKVKGRDTDALIVSVDGKYSVEFKPDTVFSANLGVGYDVLDNDDSITSAYAGAPGAFFHTEGVETSPWLLRGGLGVAKTVGGTEVSLRYDLERRVEFVNQSASVKVRWAF